MLRPVKGKSQIETNWELVENKWEIIEIVSKVRLVSSEERVVRAEWGAPRRGNESIAQRQATLGAAPWGRNERGIAPCKGKSPILQADVLLLPL